MRCQQSCHMQMDQSQWNSMFILQYLLMYILYIYIYTGWLFRTFFIFPNSWYDDPIWLIFFRGVETTNQYVYIYIHIHMGEESSMTTSWFVQTRYRSFWSLVITNGSQAPMGCFAFVSGMEMPQKRCEHVWTGYMVIPPKRKRGYLT